IAGRSAMYFAQPLDLCRIRPEYPAPSFPTALDPSPIGPVDERHDGDRDFSCQRGQPPLVLSQSLPVPRARSVAHQPDLSHQLKNPVPVVALGLFGRSEALGVESFSNLARVDT